MATYVLVRTVTDRVSKYPGPYSEPEDAAMADIVRLEEMHKEMLLQEKMRNGR